MVDLHEPGPGGIVYLGAYQMSAARIPPPHGSLAHKVAGLPPAMAPAFEIIPPTIGCRIFLKIDPRTGIRPRLPRLGYGGRGVAGITGRRGAHLTSRRERGACFRSSPQFCIIPLSEKQMKNDPACLNPFRYTEREGLANLFL